MDRAARLAVEAMWAADPTPEATDWLPLWAGDGPGLANAPDRVPASWAARRAALSVPGVEVEVGRRHAAPCWTASMRLPGGGVEGGAAGPGGGYVAHTPVKVKSRTS